MAEDKPDFRKRIESVLRRHFETCYKCRRPAPARRADAADWGVRTFLNYPIGIICPDCQSPQDWAESAIRQATSTYALEGGRIIQHPKPMDEDEDDQDNPRSA